MDEKKREALRDLRGQIAKTLEQPIAVGQLADAAELVRMFELLNDSVELEPERHLWDWNLLFLKNGMARFAGREDELRRWHDAGRISSEVVAFDAAARVGLTVTGRAYVLHGAPLSWREWDSRVSRRVAPSWLQEQIAYTLTDPNPRSMKWLDDGAKRRGEAVPDWESGDCCLMPQAAAYLIMPPHPEAAMKEFFLESLHAALATVSREDQARFLQFLAFRRDTGQEAFHFDQGADALYLLVKYGIDPLFRNMPRELLGEAIELAQRVIAADLKDGGDHE